MRSLFSTNVVTAVEEVDNVVQDTEHEVSRALPTDYSVNGEGVANINYL